MDDSEKSKKEYTYIYRALVIFFLTSSFILLIQLNKKAYNTNKFLARLVVASTMKSPLDIKYDANDIIIGEKDAPVDIFVYTSYRCKYCGEFFETIFPKLKKEYIDNGQVKIIIKNIGYTSDSISMLAAKAAYCAYAEGQFFDIHMKLLEGYDVLNKSAILNWMIDAGKDSSQFKSCLNNKILEDLIFENRKEARAIGARGTPAFVIGNNVLNGKRPLSRFKELIEVEIEVCE
jgi:protein-disulfide isomerase